MSGQGGRQERMAAIEARLAEVLGEPLSGDLRRLSSGASRETFTFATPSHGELVVQIARGRGNKLVNAPDQAALLRAAADCGVPVPAVVADGADDEILGVSWVVVEALAGTTDPKPILAGEGVPGPEHLLDDLAAALAAIHRMDVEATGVPTIEDPIALLREWNDRLGEPHPAFELAFRALDAQRPDAGPPGSGPGRLDQTRAGQAGAESTTTARRTLVHGDFRMGNLMVGADGLTGVLDWELPHAGDPVEDLGWLCVPAWRFTRLDRPAAGLGTHEQLLAAYERHSGVAVDPAALRWWELAGTLRWGVICVMQAFTHLSGATQSVEHAVIGRRACEVEWDLLQLLDPDPTGDEVLQAGLAARRHVPPPPQLHDRPTAVELLEAARGALGDDVLPQLEGRPAFQARVVLRALGMVRRELENSHEHRALHAAALASVGCADEGELAQAIREGALGEREQHVLPAVRATVRAKLEVANPGYLAQVEEAAKQTRGAQTTQTATREEQ
jgi:aminoglycoside phosphotransferase (APT) family kinase protein